MSDCWFFHDWDKWEHYEKIFIITKQAPWLKEPISGETAEDWQKRKCKKCGKEQREKI
jgi:hypothetical protein